jgi:hypothetical protein
MLRAYLLALLLAAPVLAGNLIGNPGFGPPAEGGLGHGWRANCYGDVQGSFSLDVTNPHSAPTCQKIEAGRGASGAAQFLRPLKIEARKRYHVQLWVRAEGKMPCVGACLRQLPEPYRRYLEGQATPTRDWQLLDFTGFVPTSDDNAGLYVWFEPQGSGTVWVDDVLVEIIEPTQVLGPAPTRNVVPNGSFELDTARTWEPSGAVEVAPAIWPAGLQARAAALPLRGLPAGPRVLDTMGNPLATGGGAVAVDRHPVYLVAADMRARDLARKVAKAARSAAR